MNLKRQLLLVSLLTLVLPWAGYQFIRETESALRAGQQQFLAGTARAIADSLTRYAEEFPPVRPAGHLSAAQLYGHRLESQPGIDGYIDDWSLDERSLESIGGVDGPIHYAIGLIDDAVYLYVSVTDRNVVYARAGGGSLDAAAAYSDRVSLLSISPPYLEETLSFAAEAPGPIVTSVNNAYGFAPEPAIRAYWQDVPGGYQLEARIPASELGTNLGIIVANTNSDREVPVRSSSFSTPMPGPFVHPSQELNRITAELVQPGMRLLVTDDSGWRIAQSGTLSNGNSRGSGAAAAWLRIAYDALVESGEDAQLAEPDPSGREHQDYVLQALAGRESVSWFRNADTGRAVVAAAQPVKVGGRVIGTVMLQQGTDAILSLTNQGLSRLLSVTLIATIAVALTLLGYASWLSRRIVNLSTAAEGALERDGLRTTLPSATARDEVGALSRSFANVLRQLGDYNDYLRSLASKLSHELRTPLAIVTSSLENLEHEPLNETSRRYASRARDGAERLRRILTAMSEARRVEELMANAEPETFDLAAALASTVGAYRDVYGERRFELSCPAGPVVMAGSPELIIQMLDKLVDNAVDFSEPEATICISLDRLDDRLVLSVTNPGPPLPDKMRTQLFDSMVSMRPDSGNRHLGLGLYIARLIAEGHGGKIEAENTEDGVSVTVSLQGGSRGV